MIDPAESGRPTTERMNILMLGTRGLPATYGGFETAVEQIAPRLVERGHAVTVYCRTESQLDMWNGVRLVHRPALRRKTMETLSHTAACLPHALRQPNPIVVGFNAATAPTLIPFRLRRVPLAIHVDGLEWRRAKWSSVGQTYYRLAERLAARLADDIVADARGIQDYYLETYNRSTTYIPYGTKIISQPRSQLRTLRANSLKPHNYHLIVARFEPENHVKEMVQAYRDSAARLPLVVVGDAAYRSRYIDELMELLRRTTNIKWLGRVDDSDMLDELYRGCRLYLHGHSVGGTNPSLLRAMGAAAAVVAFDVNFNREVLGDTGEFFPDQPTLACQIANAETDVESTVNRGAAAQARARSNFRWSSVVEAYERMLIAIRQPTRD